MSALRRWTADALDQLDAAVFSGDEFVNPEARAELREGLARLERGLAGFDRSELPEVHARNDTHKTVPG